MDDTILYTGEFSTGIITVRVTVPMFDGVPSPCLAMENDHGPLHQLMAAMGKEELLLLRSMIDAALFLVDSSMVVEVAS